MCSGTPGRSLGQKRQLDPAESPPAAKRPKPLLPRPKISAAAARRRSLQLRQRREEEEQRLTAEKLAAEKEREPQRIAEEKVAKNLRLLKLKTPGEKIPAWNENKFCEDCDFNGYKRYWCPRCVCNVCKKDDHLADWCPRNGKPWRFQAATAVLSDSPLATITFQPSKVQRQSACASKVQQDIAGASKVRQDIAGASKVRQDIAGASKVQQDIAGASRVQRDAAKAPRKFRPVPWSVTAPGNGEIPPVKFKSTKAAVATVTITFPSLKALATDLAQSFLSLRPGYHYGHDYKMLVQTYGGSERLVQDGLNCIHSSIRKLEGKELTPQLLREAQSELIADLSPRSETGGYLDFVTDDRDELYLRFYIGQARVLPLRWHDHALSILRGQFDTLHYYLLQLGDGHRTAHLIELWHLPHSPRRTAPHTGLLQNFLEFLFCRAFESLPGECFRSFFTNTKPMSKTYSNIGLNVLTPLLQAAVPSGATRDHFRNLLLISMDSEIKSWVVERQRQVAVSRSKRRQKLRTVVVDDLNESILTTLVVKRDAFRNLCDQAGVSMDLECCLTFLRSTATTTSLHVGKLKRTCFGPENAAVDPIGDANRAKIGIIADNAFMDESAASTHAASLMSSLGLHVGNSLSWTYNHTELGFLCQENPERPLEGSSNEFTRLLILQSTVRVILLCGELSERSCLMAFQNHNLHLSGPHNIELRRQIIAVWLLVNLTTGEPVRIFIRTPELFGINVVNDMDIVHHVGEIFRFTAFLTASPLNCYYLETATAQARIFRQMRFENLGLEIEEMNAEDLDPLIKHYLFRKGIRSEREIERLQKITGNLCTSICMLMHYFSLRPEKLGYPRSQKASKARKPDSERKSWNTEQYQAIGECYQEIVKRRNLPVASRDDEVTGSRSRSPEPTASKSSFGRETVPSTISDSDELVNLPIEEHALNSISADQDLGSDDEQNLSRADTRIDQILRLLIDLPADIESIEAVCDDIDREEFGEDEIVVSHGTQSSTQGHCMGRLDWHEELRSNSSVLPDFESEPASSASTRTELISPSGRRYRGYRRSDEDAVLQVGPLKVTIPTAIVRDWNGDFWIGIDVAPAGEIHPKRYYQHEMEPDDFGNRLAIWLSGGPSSNKAPHWMFGRKGTKTVFRLNTFGDWLEGHQVTHSLTLPRRFIRLFWKGAGGQMKSEQYFTSPVA